MKDSVIKFSLNRGFREFIWNLCPICGNSSIRTTFWEDVTVDHGECLTCMGMAEIMEIETILRKEPKKGL